MVKIHPTDPDLVYIGGTNLWRSTDGFTTPNNTSIMEVIELVLWRRWKLGYMKIMSNQHDLLFLPSDNKVILSATDGGVYKSFDTFKIQLSGNH